MQPSTIDGYKTAIADKVWHYSLNISKNKNLTRQRDRPRGISSWNLSLVLQQLIKPFELQRKTSLKHLTFKTVFLVALDLGKRRSEITTWLNRSIQHQSDWSKGSLYLPLSFFLNNQTGERWLRECCPGGYPSLSP